MGFISRSLFVLLALYGMVFVLGDLWLMHGNAPVWSGFVFVCALMLVQYLVSPLIIEWVYSIDFDSTEIQEAQREFVERHCKERGIPMPRLGVIYSDTPNAFAYGRVRRDARIVVTEGLLKVLTPDEANAVLAHELGHIAHYDFATMAVASLAPLLLYQIYVWADRIGSYGRLVSYGAYVCYWVGQFLVLLLNRTREYGADHFSAEITQEPNLLSSALVKIAYGMVKDRGEQRRLMVEGESSEHKKDAQKRLQFGQAVSLMGIAAVNSGEALALSYGATPEEAARVMSWDLVNPWSRVYEISSTHPLTAMRLRALNREAIRCGKPVAYPLPEDTKVRWAGFPIEFFFWAAPLVSGFLIVSLLWIGHSLERYVGVELPAHLLPWLMVGLGVTWAAKIAYRYRGTFTAKQVGQLLDNMSVSQMRPYAVELSGEVIGNGIPGAIWSPDLMLQDETGMMFLLYRSSIPLGRLFFAMRNADRFIGEKVTVKGWYRRGLRPYVEISEVRANLSKARPGRGMTTIFTGEGSEAPLEYSDVVQRSYSRWIQMAVAAVATATGIIWLMA